MIELVNKFQILRAEIEKYHYFMILHKFTYKSNL